MSSNTTNPTSSSGTGASNAAATAGQTQAAGATAAAIGNSLVGDYTITKIADERTDNNVMRHAYKVLGEDAKAAMQKAKDDGLALWQFIDGLGKSRELSVAKTKIEEAVMWAVKHITG